MPFTTITLFYIISPNRWRCNNNIRAAPAWKSAMTVATYMTHTKNDCFMTTTTWQTNKELFQEWWIPSLFLISSCRQGLRQQLWGFLVAVRVKKEYCTIAYNDKRSSFVELGVTSRFKSWEMRETKWTKGTQETMETKGCQ